jgi:hypothetical protein
MRLIDRKSVDFPHPEGPIKAVTLPVVISQKTSLTAADLP